MALPPIIEDKDKTWLYKVITQSSEPELNACLMGFFLGSGMTTLEICRIQVKDIFKKNGELTKCFPVKGEVERDFYLSNIKLQNLIKTYAEKRKKDGDHPDLYNGFDADSPFFKRSNGDHFKIKRRTTDKGNTSFHCNALNNHVKRLLADAGIEQPSILSGRRTFAVRLKRHGVDVPTIHLMLGNKTLDTTLRLIETDTVSMLKIAEMAF
ncbi:site-specific integrase [Vibrio vulnificus]|uniref:site-specific integrase n=1 Tax=Vibrio vulnificus TaxID=672 RepID=UPI000BA0DD1F|nr:site-specific integrase [Vibrio vulnificus]EGR0790992.1 site-specific integrase [Vibrio vulnificus]EGR0799572.1 site-specific integrase [Vibrio vulnificus]EGR0817052.1 site-specific integrase [Vibrio vulnificus]EGR0828818.1 site-specific integrase [Vibrio vulnificus]EGR0849319.1 site-specific integrase [Vibrio vulnificus]